MLEGWKCPVCGVGVHPLEKVCPNCVNRYMYIPTYTPNYPVGPKPYGNDFIVTCKAGTDVGTNKNVFTTSNSTNITLSTQYEINSAYKKYINNLSEVERELLFNNQDC